MNKASTTTARIASRPATFTCRATIVRAGPPPGVQIAVCLRLQLLLPLLPLIYADREQDPARNLRHVLAHALLQLLGSPLLQQSIGQAHSLTMPLLDLGTTGTNTDVPDRVLEQHDATGQACAAAERGAGVSLWLRLLHVFHATLAGSWAAWLKTEVCCSLLCTAYKQSAHASHYSSYVYIGR